MSTPPTYSTAEERREATALAGEPSDEAVEKTLREEAHHHRGTTYVRHGEARGEEGGGGESRGASSHQAQQHSGETETAADVAADVAQHNRKLHGVRDTTKLDAVR